MLSLYKLEIFAAVVQAGSFSAAAQCLYMTQPAVSQHMQDLEASLGTSLFNRGRRGVTLTAAGETLHDYTQRILRLVAEAESEVTNVENLISGQITIGATPGVSVYLLPEWINSFRARYPSLNVVLQTDVTTKTVNGVLENKLDIGFVEGELERIQRKALNYLVLRPVNLFVIVSSEHEWVQRKQVAIQMLDGQAFIARQPNSRTRVWMDSILKAHDVSPRIVGEYDNQEAIKQSVMSNMGLTILPDYAVSRECDTGLLHALSIENVPLQRQLKLIWNGNTSFTPVTRALLQHLAQTFPQLAELL